MTRQEAFDAAVRGLYAQGWTRATVGASCKYRTDGGAKCALGHIIPDELYDPSMEGQAPGDHSGLDAVCVYLGFEGDFTFLRSLQACHDGGYTPTHMVSRLRVLAANQVLAWPSGVPTVVDAEPEEP